MTSIKADVLDGIVFLIAQYPFLRSYFTGVCETDLSRAGAFIVQWQMLLYTFGWGRPRPRKDAMTLKPAWKLGGFIVKDFSLIVGGTDVLLG